ncbi:hypothetical protein OTU49_015804, partial [Cherax quadricarinatus]
NLLIPSNLPLVTTFFPPTFFFHSFSFLQPLPSSTAYLQPLPSSTAYLQPLPSSTACLQPLLSSTAYLQLLPSAYLQPLPPIKLLPSSCSFLQHSFVNKFTLVHEDIMLNDAGKCKLLHNKKKLVLKKNYQKRSVKVFSLLSSNLKFLT